MRDISRNLDGYINRLMPTTGSMYNRIFEMYLSAGLIYGEDSNLILVEKLYSLAYPHDLNHKLKCSPLLGKLVGLWQLRVLANIGEKQFNTYLSMNRLLAEEEDLIGLALKLNDDIKSVAKPNLTYSDNIREAIKKVIEDDDFTIVNKIMYCTHYKPDYLLVSNILNYEISTFNSYMLDDIIQAINDVENKEVTSDKFLDMAKHVSNTLSELNNSKDAMRLPAMYEPFYEMIDRFILEHDESYKRNKLTPKRLRLLKD